MSREIYVDLDGVLADFDKGISEISGVNPSIMTRSNVYKAIDISYEQGIAFFENLSLTEDAMELWEYIKPFNTKILTSSGSSRDCVMKEKINWGKIHFPGVLVITVNHSYQKSFYAHKDAILIDDRTKSIDPWVKEGGIGILHCSAEETIKSLMEIK